MRLWRGLIIAFSTYSRIPMPRVDWKDDSMRYSICFFPLVGAVVGGLMALWLWLCDAIAIGPVLRGAVGALMPVIVTGGIHMDGLIDTVDAISSWQTRERRLEILKDPHVGAFGVIGCACYLLAMAGILSEASFGAGAAIIAAGFMLSRALSAAALVWFKSAKSGGLLNSFKEASQRRAVMIAMGALILALSVALVIINPPTALAGLASCALSFIYYRRMSYKHFGGITGDLAGYFLQICEFAFIFAVVMAGRYFI